MNVQDELSRFSNKSLKNTTSHTGYRLFITPSSKAQIEKFEGHNRVQIDKTIQLLASVPRPRNAGKPVVLRGFDSYRLTNGCCMIDYDVKEGKVIVTRVVYKKLPERSGEIIIKGNLGWLQKSTQSLVKDLEFWRALDRAESRMGHFRVTGKKENQITGAAIYFDPFP